MCMYVCGGGESKTKLCDHACVRMTEGMCICIHMLCVCMCERKNDDHVGVSDCVFERACV